MFESRRGHQLNAVITEDVIVHPARFPADLPLFFVNLQTDPGDVVVDIFAGSNVTGFVCEHIDRKWISVELDPDYVRGSQFRFETECPAPNTVTIGTTKTKKFGTGVSRNGFAKRHLGNGHTKRKQKTSKK